ncbi:MAG TPA: ABC transporter permease [Acidimicrobiales bacterium]|nr:ABC transporter permease [Acidimicrobiales bacterium]
MAPGHAGTGVRVLTAARADGAEVAASRAKQAGLVALVGVNLFALVRAGDAGTFTRFFVLGVADGCVLAIAATGLVLTYTTTGVFNFAHGAVGMVAAYAYYTLRVDLGVATPVAVAAVLVVLAPAVGLLLELVLRPFRRAPATTSIVVTVAVTILLIGVVQVLYPTTGAGRPVPALLGDRTVSVLGARISWDKAAALAVAVAMAFALRALLFRTRLGVAMRAQVDDADLAGLNGAPPAAIARASWVAGSVLAALAGVLLAGGTGLEPVNLTFAIVAAYGAAVCGGLRSLPLTFAGAVILGLLRNEALLALPAGSGWQRLATSIPGLFLFAALLFLPEARLRTGRAAGRRVPRVPGSAASIAGAVAFVAAAFVVARVTPAAYLPDVTRGVIFGVVALSLVALTGFSGQVSLCQYVFVALGAWAMGSWFGGHSALGMVAAGLVAVPAGVVVALPAMRLQGLYLALATLGVAIFSRELVLRDDRIFGVRPVHVGRLGVAGVDFSSNEAFLVLCAFVFAVVAVALLALRRGPFGRCLAAMGDSSAACATLGLDVRRTKLVVFGLSAFIAGVAGALLGGLNGFVSEISFEPINNVVLLLFAAVGGITTVTGALIGGALFALLPLVQSKQPELAGLVLAAVAAGAIGLGRQPDGIAGLLFDGASEWRRLRPAGQERGLGAAGRAGAGQGATVGTPL